MEARAKLSNNVGLKAKGSKELRHTPHVKKAQTPLDVTVLKTVQCSDENGQASPQYPSDYIAVDV